MPWLDISEKLFQLGLAGILLVVGAWVIWKLVKEYQTKSEQLRLEIRGCDAERITDAHKMIPVIAGNSEALEGIANAMASRDRLMEALNASFTLNAQKLESVERHQKAEVDRFRDQMNRMEALIERLVRERGT